MSDQKTKKKDSRKRKNRNKNTSGESQQKIRVSDTQPENVTIPRMSTQPPLAAMSMTPLIQSTPQAGYTVNQYSPYGPPGPQGQFAGYVSPNQQHTFTDYQLLEKLSQKIDRMTSKLDKLDVIETRLTSLESSINSVCGDVKSLSEKVTDMEGGLSMLNNNCEKNATDLNEMKKCMKKLGSMSDKLKEDSDMTKSDISQLHQDVSDLRERNLDLQTRSMRDNLVFTGILEEQGEDTEEKLKTFIRETMSLSKDFEFERAHRLGKFIPGRCRPIVAKFSSYKDKEIVRRAAPTALRNSNYGVNEQFPKEISDRRKQLIPHLKAAKRQNRKAVLKVDKLYIDDMPFDPSSSHLPPAHYSERRFLGSGNRQDYRPQTATYKPSRPNAAAWGPVPQRPADVRCNDAGKHASSTGSRENAEERRPVGRTDERNDNAMDTAEGAMTDRRTDDDDAKHPTQQA